MEFEINGIKSTAAFHCQWMALVLAVPRGTKS
jgi:hypothetical protein